MKKETGYAATMNPPRDEAKPPRNGYETAIESPYVGKLAPFHCDYYFPATANTRCGPILAYTQRGSYRGVRVWIARQNGDYQLAAL
jgi:hypothetical protein